MRLPGRESPQAPLAEKIKRAAFAMTMLTIVSLWGVMFAMTLLEIPDTQREANRNAVTVVGEVLSGDLENALGDLARLSRSSLVWTALTDSTGREAYLKPFLGSRERERGGAGMLLVDYRGRRVLGEPPEGVDPGRLDATAREVLQDRRPRVLVSAVPDRPLLVAVYPVLFPYTQEAIGALVGTVALQDLFARRTGRLGSGIGVELMHRDAALMSAGTEAGGRHFPTDFPLRIEHLVDDGQLSLRLYATRDPWVGPIVDRVLAACLLAAALGAVVWRLSGILAARLTRRLDRLAVACAAVSGGGAAAIPLDDSPDEIGVLARTLRDALAAYEGVNAHLETLVADKARALTLSEDRLRGAIDALEEAFVIFDQDDRLVYCNERYRQTYPSVADLIRPGVGFEEIIRTWRIRNAPEESIEDRERWVAERLRAHREGGELAQLADGERWVRIVERRTATGHTVGFRVDITELVRAKQAADAANLAKGRFLATMSHELRTPMNGILGMAQLLASPSIEDAERQEYARTILNSGRMLLLLLNDILDFSKIEADRLQLDLSPARPPEIIGAVGKLFEESARRKSVALELRWSGPTEQCYLVDQVRLRQMLSNLVDNAVKFTPSGKIVLEGREAGEDTGAAVLEFSVADTGVGIPPEKQSALFEPFSQADSSTTRKFGGTGLGLSIVRDLARLMGGDVGVESAIDQGARFWFRIRAERAECPSEAIAPEPPAPETGRAKDHAPARILVVEDNPVNLKVIQALLGRLGARVSHAVDGVDGVEAAMSPQRPDLVLMDLQMPRMDGFGATAEIRMREDQLGIPRVPIVALTADAFPETRERCLAAGMDDFVTKPVSVETLSAVIRKHSAHPSG